jgi:outer membrane lipoprotein SlyB
MKLATYAVAAAMVTGLLAGCASPSAQRERTDLPTTAQEGRVILTREVTVEGRSSGVGTVVGAATGYAVARRTRSGSSGSGRRIVRAGGAVAGGAAGSAVERRATQDTALEITVELDSGGVVTVVQQAKSGRHFAVGDEVRVVTRSDGRTWVEQ